MQLANETTLEFAQARLKLRRGLRFSTRAYGDQLRYLVEDDSSGRFFQLAFPQYTFLSLLDGRRTVADAMMKVASLLREEALDEHEAASFCKWAIESGLIESELSNSRTLREERQDKERVREALGWLNPISFRIPLFCPDAAIAIAERVFGWAVSLGGAVVWVMVCLYGFGQLLLHGDAFVSRSVHVFDPRDILWVSVTWLTLKLIHESAHGLVCKRFGGRVRSCGVLLLLLIPLPYVDVTSSWRFENKWKRILTSAAGMMAELFLAALACVVWVNSSPGPLQYHAGNVILAAALHTLLFNVNPLMRFDGYYMLADWLEVPNLSAHARAYVRGVFKKLYFGAPPRPLQETGFRAVVVRLYGFAAMAWFLVITVSLSLVASHLFRGGGLVIALIGVLFWVGRPVWMLARYLVVGSQTERVNRIWFASATAATCLLLAGFLKLCPAPTVLSAPVVIDYEPLTIVRAEADGFARRIHVHTGDTVVPGQLLATLENRELRAELQSLRIDIQRSKIRERTLTDRGEIASQMLEQESLVAMSRRLAELERLVGQLEIRSPAAGRVVSRDLASKTNTYLQPGDEFITIGSDDGVQAIALVRQEDVDLLAGRPAGEDRPLEGELRIDGESIESTFTARITDIAPRASDEVPHEAFAASNGGPLAVVPRQQIEDTNEEESDLALTSPRVKVEIELPVARRNALRAGQPGQFFIRSRNETMGAYLLAKTKTFVNKNLRHFHSM